MTELSYDTETTGLSRQKHTIFSYSICSIDGKAKVQRLDGSPLRKYMGKYELEQLWRDRSIVKIMHNCKFDLGMTEALLGRKLRDHTIHDTMLMSHVLRNDQPSHGLKELCYTLGGFPTDDEKAVKAYLRSLRGYQDVPEHIMTEYQKNDAQRTMLLYSLFWPQISSSPDVLEVYQQEVEVAKLTIDMENRGVMVRKEPLMKLIQELKDKVAVLSATTGDVHLGNPDEVAHWLFDTHGLPFSKRTGSGERSTDKDVLLELRRSHPHDAIEKVLKYRSWTRGISVLQSYLDLADEEGVIHPNIKTCHAVTGRESCENPNLQNVERESGINTPYPVPARQAFGPRPNYVNFHIDYSGIEMRLLVHYSKEPELVELACSGGDMHFPATELFFGALLETADDKTKKTYRYAAKQANFAIGYGAQVNKLAVVLAKDIPSTVKMLAEYRRRFPRLSKLMYSIMSVAKKEGFVKTAFGRTIYVPRDKAYTGVNYLIQGTAAEIMKRGQVAAAKILEEETSGEMKMLLPIHDELIIECPRRRLKDAKEVLRHCASAMTTFPGRFAVPLEVECEVATLDWAHKVKFDLKDQVK